MREESQKEKPQAVDARTEFPTHYVLTQEEYLSVIEQVRLDRLVVAWSMKRSGAHGIVIWLLGHFDKEDVHYYNETHYNNKLRGRILRGRPQLLVGKRNCVIGVEDRDFLEVSKFDTFDELLSFEKLDDKAKSIFNIIVLRNPFNMFASRMKSVRNAIQDLPADLDPKKRQDKIEKWHHMYVSQHAVGMWKSFANEFLGRTNKLSHRVPVSFDRWYVSEDYRREIAARFELQFTDQARNRLSQFGSSFDGNKYLHNASEMDVLNRWQYYREDEEYIELMSDPEMLDLTEEIFGFVPFRP